MAEKKNRVTYGLSNVHVWPITSTDEAGKPTYGTVFAVPGAVSLSLDAEGSSDPFYADDTTYAQFVSNNGYSGKLSIADIPEEFSLQVLNEVKDKDGAIFEDSSVQPNEFAMAFEFKGDAAKRRHVLYRCTATRPSISSDTKEDKIAPNTPELEFSAIPRLDNNYVKSRVEEGDAAYASWYETPHEFVAPTV